MRNESEKKKPETPTSGAVRETVPETPSVVAVEQPRGLVAAGTDPYGFKTLYDLIVAGAGVLQKLETADVQLLAGARYTTKKDLTPVIRRSIEDHRTALGLSSGSFEYFYSPAADIHLIKYTA